MNKPKVKKDSKGKKPKQLKPKPVVDENTPYHMTPKGKRELQKLYDVGKPNPDYIRVPSGNGWKFIPKSEYEANLETHEFKTKLREINGEKKNGKPKKEKKETATSSNGVEPKKVKFEGTEPKATPKSTPVKASQDASYVTRDEFE